MFKKENHFPKEHGYDCWELSFYRYVPSPDSSEVMRKEAVPDMINVSFSTAMRFLVLKAKAFKLAQDTLVQDMKTTHLKDYCEHGIFEIVCKDCQKSETEAAVESLPMHLQIATMGGTNIPNNLLWNVGHQSDRFAAWCKANSIHHIEPKDNSPPSITGTAKFIMACSLWKREKFKWWQTFSMAVCGVCLAPVVGFGTQLYLLAWSASMLSIFSLSTVGRIANYMRLTPYKTMVEVVKQVRKDWRKSVMSLAPLAIVVGASYSAYKLWSYFNKKEVQPQGSCVSLPVPKNVSGRPDPYRPPSISIPSVNLDFKTATSQQMANVLKGKLAFMRFKKDNEYKEHCVTFPVCTGYWMAPYHLAKKGYDSVEILLTDSLISNSTRSAKIEGAWKRIGNTDCALIYLPMLGDQRDIVKLFPSGDKFTSNGIGTRCVWLKAVSETSGEIALKRGEFKTNLKTAKVDPHNLDFSYDGGEYTSELPTWDGMCGSILLSDINGPSIVGIHSAGKKGSVEARTCTVLRSDVISCIEKMSNQDTSQFICAQSGDFSARLNYVGTPFTYLSHQRPKATTLFVEPGQFDVCGSTNAPHRTFRSGVRPTLIADTAIKIFDIKKTYAGPRYINHWAPWNAWVTAMSHPCDVPIKYLDMAFIDYKNHVEKHWQPDWCSRIHPLADDAVLAGIDGLKGCYAMKWTASMGIPYCKPKGDFITPSERVVPGISCPRDLPIKLQKEIAEMEEELANGRRVYAPHRCNLKDEPTDIEKDKVRIFMGSAFAYQFLVRKYFLMISVIMQEHPEIFESAVGVVAYDEGWTRLQKHTFRYSTTRCIAGDFKQYDQKIDVKVILAFFKIIVWMCEKAGYSARQLSICRGLATETAMAMFEVRNEWIMFNAGNSSGHPLTVVVNGGANSLLLRSAYYAMSSNHVVPAFAENVALITYGDDNAMSVREGVDWFNHTTIAERLCSWGITYTMADKDAVSVPYITCDKIDFLKRRWVWSEEFGRYLAPIGEASLHKSLTAAKKSDMVTPEIHSAQVVSNANMEYFMYGKEVFLEKHEKLKEILKIHDIAHHLPGGRLKNYEELSEWYLS
jgi:hypothetical protein